MLVQSQNRPIPAPRWSFSDQPAARRGAGSGPHLLPSPLLSSSLLSSADSSLPSLPPSLPPNPCSLLSSCKEKSKNIFRLIPTRSRACVYTGQCGFFLIFLLAAVLENKHLKSRLFLYVCEKKKRGDFLHFISKTLMVF